VLLLCSMPSCASHASLRPSHHTTIKKVGKWLSTNQVETSENDSLLHHKNNGEDDTHNRRRIWEISIFNILCEIDPKNRKISLWIPKITFSKNGCKLIIASSLRIWIWWRKNRWNLSLYVEIMACQKSQMHENFSSNLEWKSCIQITDENHSTWMKPIS
jgi:hypothetical protein